MYRYTHRALLSECRAFLTDYINFLTEYIGLFWEVPEADSIKIADKRRRVLLAVQGSFV